MPAPTIASTRLVCPEDEEHSAYWASVLMSKPPLATFTQAIGKKGYALKRGPSDRNFMNWKRVFLVLHFPFLSYFASNDPKARCDGIVYLPGMTHEHLKHYPSVKNVLKVCPRVRRNLHHVAASDDDDNFYFSFERAEEVGEWVAKFQSEALRAENSGQFLCSDDDDDEETKALKVSISAGNHSLRDRDTEGGQTDLASEMNETFTDLTHTLSARNQADTAARKTQCDPHNVSDLKRKSFFASSDVVKSHNSDAVHHQHCTTCKMAPVFGFMYTDVSSDSVVLCGSCFREGDFDPRHLFLVTPDVDGECLRLQASVEGSCKAFRAVELVVLESMFRVIGGDMDGSPTRPISKRRMIAFWRNSGVDELMSIAEKDLLTLCRHPSAISFEEFVFLVRCRLALSPAEAAVLEQPDEAPPSAAGGPLGIATRWPAFAVVAAAVERLAAMLRAAQRGKDIVAYRAAIQELRGEATNRGFSLLERAALNVVVSSVAFDVPELGTVVPVQLLEFIFERLAMLTDEYANTAASRSPGTQPSALPSSSSLYSGFDAYAVHLLDEQLAVVRGSGSVPTKQKGAAPAAVAAAGGDAEHLRRVVLVGDVEGAVEFEWVRIGLDKVSSSSDPKRSAFLSASHRLCDVLESVLCYELGQGLGFYTQQPETIHALGCNLCGAMPIVGFAFKCTVCPDHDVCLRCFQEHPHERYHTFTRYPGGAILAPPKVKVQVVGAPASVSSGRGNNAPAGTSDAVAAAAEVKNLRKVGFFVS